jgi:hypothetical protein
MEWLAAVALGLVFLTGLATMAMLVWQVTSFDHK